MCACYTVNELRQTLQVSYDEWQYRDLWKECKESVTYHYYVQ